MRVAHGKVVPRDRFAIGGRMKNTRQKPIGERLPLALRKEADRKPATEVDRLDRKSHLLRPLGQRQQLDDESLVADRSRDLRADVGGDASEAESRGGCNPSEHVGCFVDVKPELRPIGGRCLIVGCQTGERHPSEPDENPDGLSVCVEGVQGRQLVGIVYRDQSAGVCGHPEVVVGLGIAVADDVLGRNPLLDCCAKLKFRGGIDPEAEPMRGADRATAGV